MSARLGRGCRLFSLLAIVLLPSTIASAWEIASFETHVTVHEDSTATVDETILADFTGESRHGLYRDIPIHYTDRAGQHFLLRLRVQDVTDGSGRPWPYQLESWGRYRRVRIGSADATVTGLQTYRIVYTVERGAVRFFPDHDECYWNLTGNEWAVPMRRVRAEIELPASANEVRVIAYVGGYGSTDRLEHPRVAESAILLEPPRAFEPYEGMTAAVAWAKGVVHPPSLGQVLSWWFADNWVYGLPLLMFLGMYWLWSVRGRDPRPGLSQVVQYEPPDGLTPAEMGTLMDERADLRDITATVIDLAVRGYLRIEPHQHSAFGIKWGSDYRLVNLKPWEGDPQLKPHERDLLQGIFGTPMAAKDFSDLEQVFYEHLPGIRDDLYDGLVKAGYLDSDPRSVRMMYIAFGVIGGLVMATGLLSTISWHQLPVLPILLASGFSTLIIVLFAFIMPRRTMKGAKTTDQIFGFLEFLRRTDQDRIRRINDPALFERCLPYALAFGVADQWARAFEGIYTQPPSWYAGRWGTFSARQLSYDLHHATASMGRSFTSVPRSAGGSSGSWGGSGSGGGGFSGGGGGGGGGGAW